MSVVNKMLRDLEQREHQDDISADYQPSANSQLPLVRIALASLVVVSLIIVVWWQWPRGDEPGHAPAPAVISNPLESAPAMEAEQQQRPRQDLPAAFSRKEVQVRSVANLDESPPDMAAESAVPVDGIPGGLAQVSEGEGVEPPLASASTNMAASEQQMAGQPPVVRVQRTQAQRETSSPSAPAQIPGQGAAVAISNERSAKDSELAQLKSRVKLELASGDKRQAIQTLEQILALEPGNLAAIKRLAALHFGNGSHGSAVAWLNQGLSHHPGDAELLMMLARVYNHNQQAAQALELLRQYQPPRADYLRLRGHLAQQLGDNQQARDDYQKLVRLNPADAAHWLGLAVAQDRLGAKDEAIRAYKKVVLLGGLSGAVMDFAAQRLQALGG